MGNSDKTVLIEILSGEIVIEKKFASKIEVTFKEKQTEENGYKVGVEATLRFSEGETEELVRALEYLNNR